jgi:FkbM family methyltransferase
MVCSICGAFRKLVIHYPFGAIRRVYRFIFARPSMQRINNAILELALHGRGYNNCCDFKSTGEAIFFQILSKYNPKLCIDVGANIGHYAERLLSITNTDVIAFEPLPKAYEKLSKLKGKFPNRLITINEGVGSESAELELYFGGEESELASFCGEVNQIEYVALENTNTIKVPVNTLDNYFSESQFKDHEIDLLKIDTEGFEYEVLFGAKNTIDKLKPKFIQIEYNLHQLFRLHTLQSIAILLPNYLPYQMLPFGKGLVMRDAKSPESNIYHYSNFVFVRKDIKL